MGQLSMKIMPLPGSHGNQHPDMQMFVGLGQAIDNCTLAAIKIGLRAD
jgi:hypothetical protein